MKKILLCGTLLTSLCTMGTVWATCTYEEVEKADAYWAQTLKLHNPHKIAMLYGEDAILLGTYENIPLTTYDERVNYFTTLFKKVPNIRVEYDKTYIKVLKQEGVSSGLYTFYGKSDDGKEIRLPARYSFVYESTPRGCELIVHHSSALPVQFTSADQVD